MKRKLKWIAVVLAVLLLGFGTALFLWPRDRITPSTYGRLTLGMTQKDVESLIGLPPGDYSGAPRGIGGFLSQPTWGTSILELGLPGRDIPQDWYTEHGQGTVKY